MELNKNKIANNIEILIENLGYLFIELNFRGDSRNYILDIFIDNENGITTDDCATVSRAIGEMLESDGLIKSRYRIDVSSPGVDRPLKYVQQFKKNIGRTFELMLEDDSNSIVDGKLLDVIDDGLKFKIKNENQIIDIKNIKSAKVKIRF